MSDEAFYRVCAEHPDFDLKLSAHGELIIIVQTYTWCGARNNETSRQLANWALQDKRGVAFDSSTGWLLPNSARRIAGCGLDLETADQGFRSCCL